MGAEQVGDEREMGRFEAKLDMLIDEVSSLKEQMTKGYVPRTELNTWFERIITLEQHPHKSKATFYNAISTLAFVISALTGLAMIFKK